MFTKGKFENQKYPLKYKNPNNVIPFVRLWVFQACVREGEPIYNEIVSFQVNIWSYLCNNFVSV